MRRGSSWTCARQQRRPPAELRPGRGGRRAVRRARGRRVAGPGSARPPAEGRGDQDRAGRRRRCRRRPGRAAGDLTRQLTWTSWRCWPSSTATPAPSRGSWMPCGAGTPSTTRRSGSARTAPRPPSTSGWSPSCEAAGITVTDSLPAGAARLSQPAARRRGSHPRGPRRVPGPGRVLPVLEPGTPVHYCASPDEHGHAPDQPAAQPPRPAASTACRRRRRRPGTPARPGAAGPGRAGWSSRGTRPGRPPPRSASGGWPALVRPPHRAARGRPVRRPAAAGHARAAAPGPGRRARPGQLSAEITGQRAGQLAGGLRHAPRRPGCRC